MKASFLYVGLVGLALLSGCQAAVSTPLWTGARTPEAAVIQLFNGPRSIMPEFELDMKTLAVRQSVPLEDHFLVMVAFRGNQTGQGLVVGPQQCLFTYEVLRARLGGWFTSGGGGGCTSVDAMNDQQNPMTFGESSNGGSGLGSHGFSTVDGQVFQKDIISVQVTWNDNQVQKVPVVDGTFIAARSGQLKMMNVVGLNESDEVIYTLNQLPDPGRK